MQNLNADIEQKLGHLLTGDYNIGNKEELIAKFLEELLYDSDDSDNELDIMTFRLCNYYDTLQKKVDSRKRKKETKRRQPKSIFKLDGNSFYNSYLHPNRIDTLMDEKSNLAKKFRKRFRVPYAMFRQIVNEIDSSTDPEWRCLQTLENKISKSAGADTIPHDILVLCCLRILGRYTLFDDLEEMCGVSATKIRTYFTNFVKVYGCHKFEEVVKAPDPYVKTELEECMHAYCITGLPGCIGSVDCVHIDWEAPYELANKTKNGRYGGSRKTMVFQAAVNNRTKILSATTAFYGTWNDATITQYDTFVQSVIRGRYKNVQYDVYDNNGQVIKHKGCWLLVDGGYPKTIPHLQYPSGNSDESDAWALRKHMESVRKDVECTFGRLKKRFLILKLTIRCRDETIVAPIFHTCCALHNMLLDHDGFHLVNGSTDELEYESDSDCELDPDDEEDRVLLNAIGNVQYDMHNLRHPDLHPNANVQEMTNHDLKQVLQTHFCKLKNENRIIWPKYVKVSK